MNEEEIIKYIKDEIEDDKDTMCFFEDKENPTRKSIEECINAHQGLLDLYKQEKEKNKELEENYDKLTKHFIENHISKDKIKERMEQTKKVYDEEMKPYMIDVGDGEKVLNVTGLNKKEKEELINKRNCLLVQIKTYEMLLEEK